MEKARERFKLHDAARRLCVTPRQLLDLIDRGEIVADFDREEGRIYIPADQLPD